SYTSRRQPPGPTVARGSAPSGTSNTTITRRLTLATLDQGSAGGQGNPLDSTSTTEDQFVSNNAAMSDERLVEIVGATDHEFDPEIDGGARLAIGLLSEDVRALWACSRCRAGGCLVYVEHYDEQSNGSTYGMCVGCMTSVLDPVTIGRFC